MTRTAAALMTCLALAAVAAPANAATYPTGFQEEPIVEGLTRPTAAIWAPDGRMFVAEQDGVLKAVNPDGSTKVVLDIEERVNSAGDRGLLGIAADSQIATNGYLYLSYTAETQQPLMADGNGAMTAQVSRIQIDADSDMVPGSETIILGKRDPSLGACPAPANTSDCIPSDADSHTIGSIHSMPDGTLFLGSGDGGDYSTVNDDVLRAQNEQSYAGKMMHIDRDGLGLAGHAFCPGDSDLTHVCAKVHAKGFRNPFRFKPNGSGGFNLGDVGQGSREELDVVTTAGKNYGWPCYEGNLVYQGYEDFPVCEALYDAEGTPQGYTPPDYEYSHTLNHAIIGGPTYQSAEYPAAYTGRIFFGDYAAGNLKVLEPGPGGLVAQPFATDWFGVDLVSAPNGDIAYASFGTGASGTGSIQRIVYSPTNATPVADAKAMPQFSAAVPQEVQFDGSGSTDADGDDLTYEWTYDNGGPTVDSTDPTPVFEFDTAGTYNVRLTVDDGRGTTDDDTIRVDVGNTPPVPDITGPSDYQSGDPVNLQASATDAQDASITDFSWLKVLKHGSHDHDHDDGLGATYGFPTTTTHGADSHYEVTLTATDSGGLTGTKTVQINPQTTSLRIESLPAGGDVTLTYYSNSPFVTPYVAFEAIGFQTTIVAEESFSAGGRSYEFQSWSDGPTTRSRNVTVPGTPTTLVARYRDVTPPGAPAPPSKPALRDRSGPVFGFNPKKGLHARRSRLRGVVADPSGVKRMRVAVGRKYRNGLCAWWSTKRKRLSAPTRRCDRPAWIAATLARRRNGAYDWGVRLRRRLPAGDYRIALLAEDLGGNAAQRLGNGPRLRKP